MSKKDDAEKLNAFLGTDIRFDKLKGDEIKELVRALETPEIVAALVANIEGDLMEMAGGVASGVVAGQTDPMDVIAFFAQRWQRGEGIIGKLLQERRKGGRGGILGLNILR